MADPASEASEDNPAFTQFKEDVREWLNLPEQIKTAKEPIKLLEVRLKELEVSILQYMRKEGIEQCEIPDTFGGGVVVPKSSTAKSAVKTENRQRAFEALVKKRNIEATYDDYENEIEGTRELVTTSKLKRVKGKTTKK